MYKRQVLLLIASFVILSFTNIVAMPTMDEGMVSVEATFRPGTKVETVSEQIDVYKRQVMSRGSV